MTARMAVAALLIIPLLGACGGGSSGVIEVTDSWAPSTPPNAPAAAIYLEIDNGTDANDRLIDVEMDRCDAIELHNTTIDDDRIMRMRLAEPDAMVVPAGGRLIMAPAGLHVMCIGLDAPFREGEMLDLVVLLESGTRLTTATPVEHR
ncbi:MAG: copper chaperone PCu(A)C [Acidimicrobiia bacterium]|nr:copper chaperone PCu(A)C [Acidimicrobiia bacterium]